MTRYTREDEEISHSEFGIVKNEEYLLRLLYEPEHMIDGVVLETAIPGQDLTERGFSLDRATYIESAVIRKRIDDQTTKKPDIRKTHSIAKFICGDARGILDAENKRTFIVIDDQTEENKAHSLLYSAKEKISRSEKKEIKDELLILLQNGLINDYLLP